MKRLLIVIIVSSICGQMLFADSSNRNFRYGRISSTESDIVFFLDDFKIEETEINGMQYTRIVIDYGSTTNKKGYAELPYFSTAVQLKGEKNSDLKYEIEEYYDIELKAPLIPSRGILTRSMDIDKIPFEISSGSVSNKFYPGKIAEATTPFILRDTRGMNLIVYPFQYNSGTGILRVIKKISLKLTENDSEPINALLDKNNIIAEEMESVYSSLYINYNETKSLQVSDIGEILVVYTPENGGIIALQPYIDWKKQLGYTVNTLEVPNGTDLYAENTIKSAYESNNNILFVQLVGDWANLKSKFEYYDVTSSDGSEDPVLGHIVGRDEYQDVIIGRFSVQNEIELANQINKAINYEKYPEAEGEWYSKALGIASNEGAGAGDDGESDEAHNDIIINNKLLPSSYTGGMTCYQADGANSTLIAGYINQGVSVINYTGHGYYQEFSTPRFTNSNVNSLTNGNKLPIVIAVACLVGHLNYYSDCFAEAWLKKVDGGAVAGWFSSISQPWVPPMRGQDYFNDILTGGYDYETGPGSGFSTTEKRTTFGSLTVNAAVLTLAEAPLDESTLATIETWTLFGDASLMVRTDKPRIVENLNEVIFIENYTTKIMSGGQPYEGAKVTLFQNGTVYSSVSDSNGDVYIYHSFLEGNVILTVSGQNVNTIQKEIQIQSAEGPYVIVNNYLASENYYGSTAFISMELRNAGSAASESVSALISTESRFVTIKDAEEYFGNIEIDSVKFKENCFSIEINPDTPDGEVIRLNSIISDNYSKGTYNSVINMVVNSPVIQTSHSFNTETALQGQSQEVKFRLENKGHADLVNASAELKQVTFFDIMVSDAVQITTLNVGEYTEISFTCIYGEGITNSSFAQFELVINSENGFSSNYSYSVVVGMTESFETGDFSRNPWEFSGSKNWETDAEIFYEGGFSARSGNVLDSESATISLQLDYITDGSISFYKKISSELVYDRLSFYIDGVLIKNWSGVSDWSKFSCSVNNGIHKLSWTFSRDSSLGGGSNCAWIDNVLATGISTTGIEGQEILLPTEAVLYQNYPNPFNPVTQIKFDLAEKSDIKLNVYNVSGQIVDQISSGSLDAGFHTVEFDGSKLNSGVYYYTLESEGKSITRKMILMK